MSRPPALALVWRGAGVLAACLALVSCATPPPDLAPVPAPTSEVGRAALPSHPVPAAADETSPRGARGRVIGRSDRLLLYAPADGDSLEGVAARFLGQASLAWSLSEANLGARMAPGQPWVVPLEPLNPLGVHSGRVQTVPILCYHRFGPSATKMVMPPSSFEAQLRWLADNGYRVVPLAAVEAFLAGRAGLPERSVVITIDDGYESVYRHAFPLLKRFGFPATLFVYTDFVGGGDALTWGQMQEMQASGLVDIQSHSKSHRNLVERIAGESDERYRQAIETELRVPRETLERRLPGAKVRHLAYPYGDANEAVIDTAGRQGVVLAATVSPGGNPFFANPLLLRRTMIFGDLSLDGFKAKLQTSRDWAVP